MIFLRSTILISVCRSKFYGVLQLNSDWSLFYKLKCFIVYLKMSSPLKSGDSDVSSDYSIPPGDKLNSIALVAQALQVACLYVCLITHYFSLNLMIYHYLSYPCREFQCTI